MSFRWWLALVISGLVSLSVVTVGAVAIRAGQRSVEDVTTRLRHQHTARILEQVERQISVPELINRINSDDMSLGMLDISDKDLLAKRFARQVMAFESVGYVGLAHADGQYVVFERLANNQYQLEIADDGESGLHSYGATALGDRLAQLRFDADYDLRKRPWYLDAQRASAPTWSKPYVWEQQKEVCVDRLWPTLGPDGQIIYVWETGFLFTGLNRQMKSLDVGTGIAFILDADGMLVATSRGLTLLDIDDKLQRVAGVDADEGVVAESSQALVPYWPSLQSGGPEVQLSYGTNTGNVHVMATPLPRQHGLPWTIVVALPEADFLGPVEESKRNTQILALILLAMSLMIAIVISRRVSRPLTLLAEDARRIQNGELDVAFTAATGRDEFGTLAQALRDMVRSIEQRQRITEAFGRYVNPDLAEKMLSKGDALELGGKEQVVTILMSDLRGFTSLSQRLGPKRLIELLNAYLASMTDVIADHDGMVVEFIGDAILVLFGTPDQRPDDARRAVACSVHMQMALLEFNRLNEKNDIPPLEMGIGIHTGTVIVGNIGSTDHVKYGVVGDPVNMTSRIESLTVGTQIIISDAVAKQVDRMAELENRHEVEFKGSTRTTAVWEVVGLQDESLHFRKQERPMRPVKVPAKLWKMQGKTLAPTGLTSTVVSMNLAQFALTTKAHLKTGMDVRLRLETHAGATGDIYGKVTEADGDVWTVVITSMTPDDKEILRNVLE
jgi:adenylate cyclase